MRLPVFKGKFVSTQWNMLLWRYIRENQSTLVLITLATRSAPSPTWANADFWDNCHPFIINEFVGSICRCLICWRMFKIKAVSMAPACCICSKCVSVYNQQILSSTCYHVSRSPWANISWSENFIKTTFVELPIAMAFWSVLRIGIRLYTITNEYILLTMQWCIFSYFTTSTFVFR